MSSAFSVDFLEPTSDFQTPITILLVEKKDKVWVFIFLVRLQGKFGNCKLSDLLKFSLVSVLADIAHFAPEVVD